MSSKLKLNCIQSIRGAGQEWVKMSGSWLNVSTSLIMYISSSTVCNEGDVRLVSEVFDYPSTVTGVLEVCINSNYTSVCTDSVVFEDTKVQALAEFACGRLRYTG